MCTLVVLNYNDVNTVIQYVNKVKDFTCFNHIIIVDNLSTDNSYIQLCELKTDMIDIIKSDYNGGYGYGNNYGIRYAIERYNAKYILISNPDVEYEEKTIIRLKEIMKTDKNIGVATAMMMAPDMSISMLAAWRIPTLLQEVFETPIREKWAVTIAGTHKYTDINNTEIKERQVDCVPGSLLMINSSNMSDCGFFDENIFLYGEETVLGIKMKRQGYKTVLATDVSYIHRHSVSISKSIKSEEKRRSIMWKSRMYILEKYYNVGPLLKLIIKMYSFYNIKRLALTLYFKSSGGQDYAN